MDAKRWHAAILGAVALISLLILGWVSTASASDAVHTADKVQQS